MTHDRHPLEKASPVEPRRSLGDDLADTYGRFGGETPVHEATRTSDVSSCKEMAMVEARHHEGTASVTRAVFMLIKAFVGTGILFLPKAFENGGMWFSICLMTFVGALSYYSYMLLVHSRNAVLASTNGNVAGGASFGEIADVLYGRYMRWIVQFSIAISQIGFSCAYIIFIAEMLQAVTKSLSNCATIISVPVFIVVQIAILVPFALIRRIERLGFASLMAELFMLFGIVYILYFDINILVSQGVSSSVQALNTNSFALFIGTAVYSYEGIGLVIPIVEAMKEPQKFPRVLAITLIVSTMLFVGVGAISYAALGDTVEGPITGNLNQRHPIVQTLQILYALAILLSVPLQMFPAITILEKGSFGPNRSGAVSHKWKWSKNGFRTALVLVCILVAWAGSSELDKFVALIGNFACIPLCFIYPPIFHYRAVARTRLARIADLTLVVFGTAVMIYGTYITAKSFKDVAVHRDICNAN
ncbi:transmembrane amino acid transporter protein-domain-containing protein [Syncephalis plumigaleata]|nr:transmembrane amino acid transporter protein-domain-containing protein [Syncephalis plumigaleata]